jgi:hypothetical protein
MNSTYSLGSRSGVSVFDFHIGTPGVYVFSAQYPTGEKRPEAVMALCHGFGRKLLVTILGSLVILFGSLGAAGAMATITLVKRRRAVKRMRDGLGDTAS